MILSRRAQSIMEYVLLVSLVTAAVVYMLPRVKRGTQSMIKAAADQIGDQKGAEQVFNDATRGYLVSSNTATKTAVNNRRQDSWGWITQNSTESSETSTNSVTNAGWGKE